LDYLMRDSYMTGASYGHLDLDRILLALRFDPQTQQLVVARKGLGAIEHYLVVRSFMYGQVYNHGKNIAANWLLERAFTRARVLLAQQQLPADETIGAWLTTDQTPLSLQQYLAGDDTVFQYHLQRWQGHPDSILSDLCRRWCDRDLFKAYEVSHLAPEEQEIRLQNSRSQAQSQGLDAQYYIGLYRSRRSGYTLYQKGIKLQTSSGLTEISEVSPLIRTLIQTQEQAWLVMPRSIDQGI